MKKIIFSITLLLGLFQISYGMEKQKKSSNFTPEELEKYLSKYNGLENIDLSNKELTEITEKSFTYMSKAKSLNLSNNKLTTLPNALTGLTTLEEFILNNNPILTLPSLKDMKNLKKIDMDPKTYKKVKKSLTTEQKKNHKKTRIRTNSIASLKSNCLL